MRSRRPKADDVRPEYDFASMRGGVRGKYAQRLRESTNFVLLEPDVAAAFPTGKAVNEALRAVMQASRMIRREAARSNPPLQRTGRAKRAPGR
jgi:hypothetical protein